MAQALSLLAASLMLLQSAGADKTVTQEIHHTHWQTHTVTSTVTAPCSSSSSEPTSYWPGWAGITHMVVFGDSYTTTGFNDTLVQPNASNPLGNPAYPGYTATNGPNWVDFLTTTYNKTFLETVNLAYGGATIDSAYIEPYLPTVLSIKDQVQQEYLPVYADHPSFFDWQANNTLFAIFDGINDIGNAYSESNGSLALDLSIIEYASLVDQLYQSGARNFLFLNVPPVNRAPLTTAQGPAAETSEATQIAAWNANVTRIASNLTSTYPDATTFVFDTNAIFSQVLDDPCSHPETCPYQNTTGYCVYYENGTPSWYTLYQNCTYPVDEYFWLNTLHPTFRMMNVTAQAIAAHLS